MKKILLLISIIVFAFILNVDAQKQNKPFANDTIKGDTAVYYSNVNVIKYSGIVLFTFTKSDVTDSLNVATMQGSNTNTSTDSKWTTLTGTATLPLTSADGTTVLIKTPPDFLFYRTFLSCAAGDTVAITDAAFVIKEE